MCCKHAGSNEVPTGALSVPTAPIPHRCIAHTQQPSAHRRFLTAPVQSTQHPSTHRRTRSTHRTDAVYPNQSPLSPCSSCTRCCVTRPLLRGCCACRAHVRNDQSSVPKYETRNERVHPDRNPSPLEAQRVAAAQMALSIFARRTQSTLRLQIYIYLKT